MSVLSLSWGPSCLDSDVVVASLSSGILLLLLLVVGGGGGGLMVARVTCGWKCGKEGWKLGMGWRVISCCRSADSGSEGTSQTAIPAVTAACDRLIVIRIH